MKLCACTLCGGIFEDKNPKADAPDYPDTIPAEPLKWDDNENTWVCPTCLVDGCLTDDVVMPDLSDMCEAAYEQGGQAAVYNLVNEPYYKDKVNWENCEACDCESPTKKGDHTCLVCGSDTTPSTGQVISVDQLAENIKEIICEWDGEAIVNLYNNHISSGAYKAKYLGDSEVLLT